MLDEQHIREVGEVQRKVGQLCLLSRKIKNKKQSNSPVSGVF